MDLISIVTEDGSMSVYRTLSWEKIVQKQADDLFPDGDKIAQIEFDISGALIVIGSDRGQIVVLDIESGNVIESIKPSSIRGAGGDGDGSPVMSLLWYKIDPPSPQGNSSKFDSSSSSSSSASSSSSSSPPQNSTSAAAATSLNESELRKSCLMGGINLVHRLGQTVFMEPSVHSSQADSAQNYKKIVSSSENQMLLVVTESGTVYGYLHAIYPIFQIKLADLISGQCSSFQNINVVKGYVSDELNFLFQVTYECTSDNNNSVISLSTISMSTDKLSPLIFSLLQPCLSQVIFSKAICANIVTIIQQLGKKWTDTTRVLGPKLSLLQDSLKAYALDFTPIEAFYMQALCGHWHPGVIAKGSELFAEQGLNRLKNAIEGVDGAGGIVKALITRATPMATNVLLGCREMLNIFTLLYKKDPPHAKPAAGIASTIDTTIYKITSMIQCLESFILKIDQTVNEARLAREGLLLFIQFVRENLLPENPNTTIDLSLRDKYIALFDPRRNRPPSNCAETISCSFLYQYLAAPGSLSDSVLTAAGFATAASSSGSESCQTDSEVIDNVNLICSLLEEFSMTSYTIGDLEGSKNSSHNKYSYESCKKHSLLKHARVLNEGLDEIVPFADDLVTQSFAALPGLAPAMMISAAEYNLNKSQLVSRTGIEVYHLPSSSTNSIDLPSSSTNSIDTSQDSDSPESILISNSMVSIFANSNTFQDTNKLVVLCNSQNAHSGSKRKVYCAVADFRVSDSSSHGSSDNSVKYIGIYATPTGSDKLASTLSVVVVISAREMATGNQALVTKIDFSELRFYDITSAVDPSNSDPSNSNVVGAFALSSSVATSSSIASIVPPTPLAQTQTRALQYLNGFDDIRHVSVSGSRGVVGIGDNRGRQVLIDVENHQEEDQE